MASKKGSVMFFFFAMPFAVILLVDVNLLRNWRKTTNSQPHGQTAVPT